MLIWEQYTLLDNNSVQAHFCTTKLNCSAKRQFNVTMEPSEMKENKMGARNGRERAKHAVEIVELRIARLTKTYEKDRVRSKAEFVADMAEQRARFTKGNYCDRKENKVIFRSDVHHSTPII